MVILTNYGLDEYVFNALREGAGGFMVKDTEPADLLQGVRVAAHGLSNDEIAAHMVISPTTAKTHVSRAMTELPARDRAQLVVLAYETGLVVVPRGH